MSCQHCGWDGADRGPPEVRFEDWPKGMPLPPPLPPFESHPGGRCPSTLGVGDAIYWTGGKAGADLPPIRAVFLEVAGFVGPEFVLSDKPGRGWKQIMAAEPVTAMIRVEEEFLLLEHRKALPELEVVEDHYKVAFKELALRTKWPVLTC